MEGGGVMKKARVVRELTKQAGLELLEIHINGSGHFCGTVRANDGRTMKTVFAESPSDWRGYKNKLAVLRRFARGEKR